MDKLKSRTEWQAYLLTILVLFLDHFLGLKIDSESLFALVGATGMYGMSRGLAKSEDGGGVVQILSEGKEPAGVPPK
jgi:hypothetical protein